jgi:hypothetical protein
MGTVVSYGQNRRQLTPTHQVDIKTEKWGELALRPLVH